MRKTIMGIDGDFWFAITDSKMPDDIHRTIKWFTSMTPPQINGNWYGVAVIQEKANQVLDQGDGQISLANFKAMNLVNMADDLYTIYLFEDAEQTALFKLKWA